MNGLGARARQRQVAIGAEADPAAVRGLLSGARPARHGRGGRALRRRGVWCRSRGGAAGGGGCAWLWARAPAAAGAGHRAVQVGARCVGAFSQWLCLWARARLAPACVCRGAGDGAAVGAEPRWRAECAAAARVFGIASHQMRCGERGARACCGGVPRRRVALPRTSGCGRLWVSPTDPGRKMHPSSAQSPADGAPVATRVACADTGFGGRRPVRVSVHLSLSKPPTSLVSSSWQRCRGACATREEMVRLNRVSSAVSVGSECNEAAAAQRSTGFQGRTGASGRCATTP